MSASGYYSWSTRKISRRAERNAQLLLEIRRLHEKSRQSYGSIKIWRALNDEGVKCGKHCIAKLRQKHGIETKRRRRFKVTTRSKNNSWIEPNRLNRCFQVQEPNRVWVGDVTFIATRTGWLYLAILWIYIHAKLSGGRCQRRMTNN